MGGTRYQVHNETWKWGAAGMGRDGGMRGAGGGYPLLETESGHCVDDGRSPPERG